MAITYTPGTDLVTVDTSEYTFDDINTAIANTAVWEKLGEAHFCKSNLLITSGGSIVDENSSFQLGSTTAGKSFETSAGTELKIDNSLLAFYLNARKTSYGNWEFNKCVVIARETPYGHIGLYMRGTQTHIDTSFDVAAWYCRTAQCNFDNVKIKASNGFYYYTTGCINNLHIDGNCRINYVAFFSLSNTVITGYLSLGTDGMYGVLINTTFGELMFSYDSNYILNKYEYDIMVVDGDNNPISGASCKLTNNAGTTEFVLGTGMDGKIPTQEVLFERYDGTSETKTDYNDFELTITKSGYTDFKMPLTLTQKTDHVQSLDALTHTYDDIMEGIEEIKGTGFELETDSLRNIEANMELLLQITQGPPYPV